jgi:hypothetical protein
MEMHHFPRTSDVTEGLRYKGYVGPSEDITAKIFLSVLTAEKLTATPIFPRAVGEDLYITEGWAYLSAYNAFDLSLNDARLIVDDVDESVCAVKIKDPHISGWSRVLHTATTQEIGVTYKTGYKDGELPALYQELIINLIYYSILPSGYRDAEVEREINRLVEIANAKRVRFQKKRFTHMCQQGVV